MTRIAIVDDDTAHRTALRLLLEAHGIQAAWAEGASLAAARALAPAADLLIIDGMLPDGHGAAAAGLGCPMLLVSGAAGPRGIPAVRKPVDTRRLVREVRRLLQEARIVQATVAARRASAQDPEKCSPRSRATGGAWVNTACRSSGDAATSIQRSDTRPSATT